MNWAFGWLCVFFGFVDVVLIAVFVLNFSAVFLCITA